MMIESHSSIFRHQLNNGLLALAFVLILATSAVSVTSTNKLGASIGLVSHTHQTLELVTRMRVATGDARANGLRHLITGDSVDQMAQREALAEMYRLRLQLTEITNDNALQRSYMADFGHQYDAFLAYSMESLAYMQGASTTKRAIASAQRIRAGVGFRMISNMRQILDKMTAEENRLMISRVEERDTLVKQTNATVLIANALALVAGALGFIAIRRSQEESKRMLMIEVRAEQARQASEETSSFLANMSHEIRTPMNAIFGFTQLLSESVTAPVERTWVMSIKKSGQMLLSLINDVLDLSKIEAGKLQLQLHPVDIRELVTEIVDMFRPDAHEKNIFLECDFGLEANDPLLLDSQRVRQVLMNLLSNAIKYTERGGVKVSVALTPELDPSFRNLRLTVSDSGVGIDPGQLAKIFEPFHQAESPDGKVRQGTGLGLSICRRLVNAMQGDIQLSSELGKGSTFTVQISQVRAADRLPHKEETTDTLVDFRQIPPLKILLVDDVAWNLEIAQGYLRHSEHEIQIAENGLDAVKLAKSFRPDVVLMDLRMPGMSGFEASDAIRSDHELQDAAIKIIAVTASSLNHEEKALRESFDAYVRKPYTPQDLFHALDGLFCTKVALVDKAHPVPRKWSQHQQEQWQLLRGGELQDLQQSMRMREIGEFSNKLAQFAQNTQFELLEARASELRIAVQGFDIVAVNNVLQMIADMPERFDVT